MRRKLFFCLLAAVALLCPDSVRAGAPRLRYGLEWGFTPTFYDAWHLNYISSEGYRVDDNDSALSFTPNGLVLIDFGVNLTDRFALALYCGYAGVSKDTRVFPLLLRGSLYPKGMTSDGLFCFAEAGAGFHALKPSAPALPAALMANAGGGYHICLSRSIGLDFQMSLRGTFDHERIKDADTGDWVTGADVRRNNSHSCALCFTIGLNF